MKKIIFITILVLIFSMAGLAQNEELNLGRTYFPKDFVHAGKNFNKGTYRLTLFEKNGIPWFKILNNKREVLFEEMAIVRPNEAKNKNFRYRIKREMLRGYEYFRVKVTKPDKLIMAYFLVEKETEKKTAPEKK